MDQNYREIIWRMSSTRLFRFKERERNSREEAFFSVLLDDEKTKLATQHLYLPSSMCAVTRSQHLHFQLERREKKTNHIRRVLVSEVPDRQQEPSRRLRRR